MSNVANAVDSKMKAMKAVVQMTAAKNISSFYSLMNKMKEITIVTKNDNKNNDIKLSDLVNS